MTEAQIRDSITRGTLDAGDALDALGAGMVETYGGAAALVKETLDGAFDRVKAAVRDLGAWLAEPLVSADGGGLLLDLLKGIADALRWFEGLPDPFRNIVVGLGLLTGPLALAAGGFLLLGPRVLDTYDALRRLNSDLPLTQGRMGSLLGNVGKLAGAMAVLAVAIPVAGAIDDALTYTVDLDRLTAQLINLADATDFADSSIRGMSGNFTDSIFGRSLDTGAEQLDRIASRFESAFGQGTLTRVERTASALGNVMPFIGTAFDGAVDAIESYDQSLSQLANGGNAERAAEMFEVLYEAASRDVPELSIEQMLLTMPEYEKYLIGVANELGVTTNAAVLAALALGDIDGAITASEMSFFAQVVAELAEELGHVAGESERLADALSDSAGGLASGIAEGFSSAADAVVSEADRIVEEGLAKLRQEFGELVVSTAESSAAIMDWSGAVGRSMVGTDNATFSLSKYVAELERMAEAQLNFESNLDRLLVEFGPAFTEHMSQLDPQITAAMVRDLDEGRGDLARAVYDSWESTNPMARQAWASQHEILRSMWLAAAAEMGEDGATKITDGIRTGALDAMDAIREHGLEVELQVLADAGDPAAQHILDLLEEDEFRRITAHLDVDPATFEEKLAYLEQHTHDTVFMPKLSADPASAEEKLAFLLANTDDAVGTVTLDADPTNADYKLSQHLQDADTSTGTATIDADAAPAESERQAWLVDVDGTTGVVTMDGDGSLAFSELSLVNQYVNSSNPTVTIGAVIGQSVWNALGSIRSSFQSVTANLSSRFAGGGAVVGVGTGTSDSIPALLSNGEFVFTDAAVRGAGGFGPMYSMMHSLERGLSPLANLPAYALGGPVQPNYARVSPAPVVVQGGGGESVAALSSRIDRLASVIEADRGRPIQTSVELDGRALAKATHTSVGGRRVEGGAW